MSDENDLQDGGPSDEDDAPPSSGGTLPRDLPPELAMLPPRQEAAKWLAPDKPQPRLRVP